MNKRRVQMARSRPVFAGYWYSSSFPYTIIHTNEIPPQKLKSITLIKRKSQRKIESFTVHTSYLIEINKVCWAKIGKDTVTIVTTHCEHDVM